MSPRSFPSVIDRVDGPRPLHHLAGLERKHVWLTMAELAEHGHFLTRDGQHFSPESARKFVTSHPDLPRSRRGRLLLVDRDVFDRYVAAAGDKRTA